jgi:hypothetical protein
MPGLDDNKTVSYISYQWDTQQENSTTKHAVMYTFPDCNAWQSE